MCVRACVILGLAQRSTFHVAVAPARRGHSAIRAFDPRIFETRADKRQACRSIVQAVRGRANSKRKVHLSSAFERATEDACFFFFLNEPWLAPSFRQSITRARARSARFSPFAYRFVFPFCRWHYSLVINRKK